MVVDDEESVRTVARLILEKAGYRVITASDGVEAEEIFAESGGGISLVLLDMTMPHRDGAETYTQLRRVDPGVRVILTSGYSESDATARFAGKGLAGFIQKPYTPGELVGLVRRVLGSD